MGMFRIKVGPALPHPMTALSFEFKLNLWKEGGQEEEPVIVRLYSFSQKMKPLVVIACLAMTISIHVTRSVSFPPDRRAKKNNRRQKLIGNNVRGS